MRKMNRLSALSCHMCRGSDGSSSSSSSDTSSFPPAAVVAAATARHRRPRVAAIVTAYFPQSHADVIVTKLLKGMTTDEGLQLPMVDVVSMYIDQVHLPAFDGVYREGLPRGGLTTKTGRNIADIGMALAAEHGVQVFPSIRKALYEGTNAEDPAAQRFDLDGVVLIGEHGDYPRDEYGRTLYPQRYMFEQICGVFAELGRPVPIYVDKHLSYCAQDALWMVDRAQKLHVPLLAGSSLATCWRRPNLGECDAHARQILAQMLTCSLSRSRSLSRCQYTRISTRGIRASRGMCAC